MKLNQAERLVVNNPVRVYSSASLSAGSVKPCPRARASGSWRWAVAGAPGPLSS